MKRILFSIIATLVAFASCSKFDDTQIWDKLNEHEERIVALETLCGQMNTNIASLQTIIQALQENDYITNVVAIMENGVEVGYQITFSKGNAVTIYHGKDGKDGVDGTDGKDGVNGADGKDGVDGQAPVIGVKQDTDGVYYWTLNGEWMLDDNGNKIPTAGKDGQDGAPGADGEDGKDGADGTDGKDGVNGTDGKDGITPQLKIEEDYWYISYDNGTTWTRLGKATGEDGKDGTDGQDGAPGADGKDGIDGTDGEDGDSMFASVDVTDPDYIIFTLADGTQFKIPTWKAFEELKAMVEQMNKNIEALQTIVTALQNNDYVTSISPIYEGVREIGYVINFSKSGKVTIYHGEDGTDGKDGQDGAPGADGKDGVDGQTPVIGVKQDTDGVYYWTLNGEWLLDDNGNKISTTGQDGADGNDGQDGVDGAPGANGADGKDGVTPQLKIENDYWYISYDNGTTWAQLGKATGEDGQDGAQGPQGSAGKDGDSFFKDVDATDKDYVTITLTDGTTIKLPTWEAFEALQQRVDQMNDNVAALQDIVSALQQNDYVTSVSPLVEGGKIIGYMINFSKSGSVTIYHGQNGTDGDDGHTPVISIKQDTDGIYYWTVDGEWLKDSDGNKIPTTGKDGQDGETGAEGEAGITPQFKIEDGYWHISYDNGATWTRLGKATGEDGKDGAQGPQGPAGKDGDSFFKEVTQDEYYVYLTLSDGTVVQIPNGPSYTDVPQINNSYIRPKTKDEPIKILCFGSSWFHNTWWYLNKITKNLGINAEIHGYDLGSSYFDEWIDLYNNDLSPFIGSLSWRGAYRYVSINGEDYTCSERVAGSDFGDQEYRDAWYNDLVSEEWDIIAFQQGAIQAPEWKYWERGSELVSIIKRHCGPNTMIAFNHTWTPSITSQYIPNATNGLCSNTLEGQKLWQTMNDDNCKRFMNITGLNDISPNGAMMYTLRRDQKINSDGDDLCHDGLHPNHGLPMFAIACVFYETFIAPFYGISIKECTWLPETSDKRVPFNSSVFRPVTETKRDRIYEYVRLSLSNRFGFNEPYPYDESFNNSNEDLGSSEGEW